MQCLTENAETFSSQDEWQTNHNTHQQHAADRTKAEYRNINQGRYRRRNSSQNKNHQGTATGHPMDQADKKWPGSEFDQVPMPVCLLLARPVQVHVHVFSTVMSVPVKVDFQTAQGPQQ